MRSQLSSSLFLVLFSLAIGLAPMTARATDTFNTIDYPGAANTWAFGNNDQGEIVGYYDISGITHGFFLGKDGFVSIDYPGACRTEAWAINPAGSIVGVYYEPPLTGVCITGKQHGYLLRKGHFTSIDVPGATLTGAYDINPEGDIVGHYGVPPTGRMAGFLLRNGNFTTYAHPDAVAANKMTCGVGITPQGEIVGHYQDTKGVHGFILNEAGFTAIDVQGGVNVQAHGVNPEEEIVGFFIGSDNKYHGFLLDKWDLMTQIDVPGAVNTLVRRNNSRGDLVGNYRDAAGMHGFLVLH